jgi:hypothetical protein
MTKPLIERLRDFGGFRNEMEICDEAADEIERLTAERDALKAALEELRNERRKRLFRSPVKQDLQSEIDAPEDEPVAWSPNYTYPGARRYWADGVPQPEDVEYWRKENIDILYAYLHPVHDDTALLRQCLEG